MSEPAGIHIFSLTEARKTLALIRPIVEDATTCQKKLTERLNQAPDRDENGGNPSPDPSSDQQDTAIRTYRDELSEYVHEIYDLGAEIHDFDRGRVDFPARLGHRVVYLCWDLNDDDIQYWHDTYAACHERQAIDEEDFE